MYQGDSAAPESFGSSEADTVKRKTSGLPISPLNRRPKPQEELLPLRCPERTRSTRRDLRQRRVVRFSKGTTMIQSRLWNGTVAEWPILGTMRSATTIVAIIALAHIRRNVARFPVKDGTGAAIDSGCDGYFTDPMKRCPSPWTVWM
jgi:hypothetical protein